MGLSPHRSALLLRSQNPSRWNVDVVPGERRSAAREGDPAFQSSHSFKHLDPLPSARPYAVAMDGLAGDDIFYFSASRTCSGLGPMPMKRAGNCRAQGQALKNFTKSGGLGVCIAS